MPPLLGFIALLCCPLVFWDNTNPTGLRRLLTDGRVLVIMAQSIVFAGFRTIALTRYEVSIKMYSVSVLGTVMLASRMMDALFLMASIIFFALMDSLIVATPRLRSLVAVLVVVPCFVDIVETEIMRYPSVLEVEGSLSFKISDKVQASLLIMLLAAVAGSVLDPTHLTFIKLPTDLMDLVLFDTGMKKEKLKNLEEEKKFHEMKGSFSKTLQYTKQALGLHEGSTPPGSPRWSPRGGGSPRVEMQHTTLSFRADQEHGGA